VSEALTDGEPTGYERIKQMSRQLKTTIPDLLALHRTNDPFFMGCPAQVAQAQWFASLWERFGYTRGIHLRRVHYQLASQHKPTRHDGERYLNTEECWKLLGDAAKAARCLKLVAADAFVDRRNPDPHLFHPAATLFGPIWGLGEWPNWWLPAIESDLRWRLNYSLPEVKVDGYDFSEGDQPYLVEVWVEKSTMDDVLSPLCEALAANLVTSAGHQSITAAVNLLQRVRRTRKPARILYVSDFDPAGDTMPVAVARQLEFWLPQYAPGADVKLTQLALTRDQVREFRLPRLPIKDTDTRKGNFEERYGEGAVELDALEALHPGEFGAMVRRAIAPYRDERLESHMAAAKLDALEVVRQEWDDATADVRRELEAIRREGRAIVREYEGRLAALNAEMQGQLAPLAERLEAVRHAAQAEAYALKVALPDRPEGEAAGADESGWLFDSARDYETQLAHYKARKVGGNGEA
jgi:hypothetical protein